MSYECGCERCIGLIIQSISKMIRWKKMYIEINTMNTLAKTEKYTFANIGKDTFTIIDIDTFVYI